MPTGTATLNFGAFPGKSDASVDVVAAGVVSTSLIEAWMHGGGPTADHTVDEHMLETVKVFARYLSDGNIRIHGVNTSEIHQDLLKPFGATPGLIGPKGPAPDQIVDPKGTRIYGQFTVAWATA